MPRRLLRDGEVVADEWLTFDEAAFGAAAELADERPLMLPLDQWLSDRDRWLSRESPLGVIVGPAHKVEILVPDLARFDLIGVEFPTIGEGRGYTQGRQLRERWRFSGELRALGCVRSDQLFFLARCGFNSFELPDGEIESARSAFATFSAAYQPANDAGLPVKLRRR